MILGIGSDIVDIRRIEKAILRFGRKFEERLFTDEEIGWANVRGQSSARARCAVFAKRFAAKEACAKALGTGIGQNAKWVEISVSNSRSGAPTLSLSGNAARQLQKITPAGMKAQVNISLSDEYPIAQAFVVISAVSQ